MPTFTDKMLKGLKPRGSGQVDVWDTLLPCFGVRVGTKTKTFFVGVRINGRYRRITLGRYDRLSLKDARDKGRNARQTTSRLLPRWSRSRWRSMICGQAEEPRIHLITNSPQSPRNG